MPLFLSVCVYERAKERERERERAMCFVYDLNVTKDQCDQMARLIIQYLTIYDYENLPNVVFFAKVT